MDDRLNPLPGDLDRQLDHEWLATNGLGGYACSTLPGLNTRKYHGLLVAALSPPVRRTVLLSRVEETVVCDGWSTPLAANEYPGTIHPRGDQSLRAFSADPFLRWAYQGQGWTVEKSLQMVPGKNTVLLTYALLGGPTGAHVELHLRPAFALRGIHDLAYQWNGSLTVENRGPGTHRIPPTGRTPECFFAHDGVFESDPNWFLNTIYRREQERGYAGLEDVWCPGVVHWSLRPGQTVTFACSADPIDGLPTVTDAPTPPAEDETLRLLTRAAEQFILTVPTRDDCPMAKYVAPSYPWAPPSPRWALISFCGLFLVTGRHAEGRDLLLRLAALMEGGLLPSALPEDGGPPAYHGVDTSLWFVNAVRNLLHYTNDLDAVRGPLADAAFAVLHHYRHGTALGIRTEVDGLLATDQPGLPTTWMDAQADGWVVTPRGGKAVEVNALWHNALRCGAELADQLGLPRPAADLARAADAARVGFNRRFWNAPAGCCFDTIDDQGADPAVRPNQLLAISLPHSVLTPNRFEPVLDAVRSYLMTPFGPRTLAPSDPNYHGHYHGNVLHRDRAYHQGSVHPWLLGHYVTAHLKTHGRTPAALADAARLLDPCLAYLRTTGCGQLCELFDGDAPHRPGGAVAAAPGVAELLRCYVQDVLERGPAARTPKPVIAGV